MSSTLPSQVLNVDAKRRRQPRQDQDGRVSAAAFDAAEIGLMHVGLVGEFFLREPSLASKRLHIEADSNPHIHVGMARSGLTLAHRL